MMNRLALASTILLVSLPPFVGAAEPTTIVAPTYHRTFSRTPGPQADQGWRGRVDEDDRLGGAR